MTSFSPPPLTGLVPRVASDTMKGYSATVLDARCGLLSSVVHGIALVCCFSRIVAVASTHV